jgi:hypothetical protein
VLVKAKKGLANIWALNSGRSENSQNTISPSFFKGKNNNIFYPQNLTIIPDLTVL